MLNRLKVTLLGDTSVGKSSIIDRFLKGDFNEFKEATIGAAYFTKIVSINDKQIRLEIWDTAGQERYKSLMPMYYRNANVIVIVYSVNDMESYKNMKYWLHEITKNILDTNYSIFIVGNKCDLKKTVSDEKVMETFNIDIFNSIKITHITTSSKYGTNINKLFEMIANTDIKNNNINIDTKVSLSEDIPKRWCLC